MLIGHRNFGIRNLENCSAFSIYYLANHWYGNQSMNHKSLQKKNQEKNSKDESEKQT